MSTETEVKTLTIKVKETTTVEKEQVIELPCFVKYQDLIYYKVISEKKLIAVTAYTSDQVSEIELKDSHVSAFNMPTTPITEAEFNEKYKEALKRIQDNSGVTL